MYERVPDDDVNPVGVGTVTVLTLLAAGVKMSCHAVNAPSVTPRAATTEAIRKG